MAIMLKLKIDLANPQVHVQATKMVDKLALALIEKKD